MYNTNKTHVMGNNKSIYNNKKASNLLQRTHILWSFIFSGGLNAMPVSRIDKDVRVIIIKGPGNTITIGHFFRNFSQLEVLRITDSQIPSMGSECFFGLVKLRILGEYRT